MSRLEILLAARSRIAHAWCQRSEAQTALGRPVEAWDALADRFCAFGAILASFAPSQFEWPEARAVLNEVAHSLDPAGTTGAEVVRFNDSPRTTQEDVIALFDRSIAHQLSIDEA